MSKKETLDSSEAERELEKQYREYKAQFDDWKEKNKSAYGTDAYIKYVQSFEAWEKNVEERRRDIRDKAERELEEKRRQAAAEEEVRRQMELQKQEDEKAQAEAYAKHQQSYLAHHQAALKQEERQHQIHANVVAVANVASVAMPDFTQPPPPFPRKDGGADAPPDAGVVMRQMMELMMGGSATLSQPAAMYQQAPPQAAGPPPKLWGDDKIPFDSNDLLFKRWGIRASPPHIAYQLPPPRMPVAVGWMLMEALPHTNYRLAPVPPPPMPAPPPGAPAQTVPLVFLPQ